MLTTHAMDEAEALCTRVAIMARGALVAIGTPAQLKHRHGAGLHIDAKARRGCGDALAAALAAALPGGADAERHGDSLRLTVPRSAGLPLSDVFARLVAVGDLAEDWTCGQESLDTVFVAVS